MLDSIIRTVSRMPLGRLHVLAQDMEALAPLVYRRRLVQANLTRAFPTADTAALAKGFYFGFAQVCVEVVRAMDMDARELRARVACEGAAPLQGGNALLLMAHHANMIWAVLALASSIEAPVSIVYKPPHAPAMRQLLLAIAARFGVELVPVKDVRKKLLQRRQRNRVWTLVADQRPGKDCCYADLCGVRTPFFLGPERIARALRWPVYYLSCQRTAAGRYACQVRKIADPPHDRPGAIINRYATLLQADIDHAPCDWLWSHDRWRQRGSQPAPPEAFAAKAPTVNRL